MKQILNHTAALVIGVVIGMFIATAAYLWAFGANDDFGYDKGYRKAQQECRDFIKNTKP